MERDILLKMNISNNSKMFLEACFVSFVVRSPSSSYISNAIAASVVNIVLAVAGTILNSFVLFIFWKSSKLRSKLSSFAIMFNRSWSWNSCPSFVCVKIYHNVGFAEMSVHCGL